MRYKLHGILIVALTLVHTFVVACDVCEKQQPKILRGVTHGAGPEGVWDYVVVGATALVAVVSLIYAVRWTLYPGETARTHIKRSILNAHEP